jgi:Fic family protein
VRTFDYSFLKSGLLPAGFINITNAISELKVLERQRKQNHVDIFTSLERIAKVQSVKGSNAIEGIVTSDERINAIVNQDSAPLNHNEAEIAGYRDALRLVHNEYAQLDLRQRDILYLHELMLSYAPVNGGIYKQTDNAIIEIDPSGIRHLRFSPTPASEVAETMEQLELAYREARNDSQINQLLLIPCFVLDFLCIHPFSDGNGRMSRLLSLLLLYKNGLDAGRYISFEEQINVSKSSYYAALKASSVGWHEGENSYSPFIESFITTLLRCYKELDKRFAIVQSRKVTKKQRIEATVTNSVLPISKKEIAALLPDVSPTTIEAVLGAMVKAGQIKKVGSSRNTKYIKRA